MKGSNKRVLRRIMHFTKSDWKHLWWLFTVMMKGIWYHNPDETLVAKRFIWLHLNFDSQLIPFIGQCPVGEPGEPGVINKEEVK